MGFNIIHQPVQPTQPVYQSNLATNFDNLLISTQNYQGMPLPSGNGITLNAADFRTEADIKSYNNQSPMDKL